MVFHQNHRRFKRRSYMAGGKAEKKSLRPSEGTLDNNQILTLAYSFVGSHDRLHQVPGLFLQTLSDELRSEHDRAEIVQAFLQTKGMAHEGGILIGSFTILLIVAVSQRLYITYLETFLLETPPQPDANGMKAGEAGS